MNLRRTDGGRLLAQYDAYWFGWVAWETDRALLLDAHSRHKVAVVRCVVGDCERASRVRRSAS